MANIYITTTGLTPSIILSDLGYRVLTHPIIDYNIGEEFSFHDLYSSVDFSNSLDFGYFTASYGGVFINSSSGFLPVLHESLSTLVGSATGPTGATGPIGNTGPTGSIGPTGSVFLNGLTSITQSFTSSNDNNVLLNISSSGSTHSFDISWAGYLPVTRGGTGTASVFTSGSIIFAGVGGTYLQDNVNLYWDDTSNKLGVGTTSPVESISTTGNIRSNGYLEILNQSRPSTPNGSSRLYFDTSNRFSWIGTNGFSRTFDGTGNTDDRVYILPNDSTTIVGLGTTQSLTNKTILSTDNNIVDATRLYGFTVSSSTPSTNNILSWNGTSWSPISNNIVGSTGPTGPQGTMNTTSITASTLTTTTTTFPNLMTGVQVGGLTAGNYLVFFGSWIGLSVNNSTLSTRIYTQTTGVATAIVASEMIFQRSNQVMNTTHNYSGYPITLNATGTVSIHWSVSAGTGTVNNPYITVIRR